LTSVIAAVRAATGSAQPANSATRSAFSPVDDHDSAGGWISGAVAARLIAVPPATG
jgi:hypothetical protein